MGFLPPITNKSGVKGFDAVNNIPVIGGLLRAATNIGQDAAAGINANLTAGARQSANNQADKQASALEHQAMGTGDMQQRKALLFQANNIRTAQGNAAQSVSQTFSPDIQKNYLTRGLEGGAAIATTADMLAHPVETVVAPFKLLKSGFKAGKAIANFTAEDARNVMPAIKNFVKEDASKSFKLPSRDGAHTASATDAVTAVAQPPERTISRITLKPSVYGAGREEAVQKTINNRVPGSTAEEQYRNLEPTMAELGNNIQSSLDANPKVVSLSGLKAKFLDNLKTTLRTKGLSTKAAETEIDGYLNDIGAYKQPQQVFKPDPNLSEAENTRAQFQHEQGNPQTISTQDIYSLKKDVNSDYQGIAKKRRNGTPLNDREKVIDAARDTLDQVISAEHPDVKALITQQSHLYDAPDSLFDARNAERKAAQVAAEQAAQDAAKPHRFTKFMRPGTVLGSHNPLTAIAGHMADEAIAPHVDMALKGMTGTKTAVPSAQMMPKIKTGNMITNSVAPLLAGGVAKQASVQDGQQINNQTTHDGDSIPQDTTSVNSLLSGNTSSPIKASDIPADVKQIQPDAQGRYSIASPLVIADKSGQPLAIAESDYKDTKKTLQQQLGDPATMYNPVKAAQVKSQLDQLESTHALSGELQQNYTDAMNISNVVGTVAQLLKDAPPSIFNQNGLVENSNTLYNGKYAGLKESLGILQKYYPVLTDSVLKSGSPQVALSVLGKIPQRVAQDYYQKINTITGNVPGATQQTTQQAIQAQQIQPSSGGELLPPPPPNKDFQVSGQMPPIQ